jgi:hypothetical protein
MAANAFALTAVFLLAGQQQPAAPLNFDTLRAAVAQAATVGSGRVQQLTVDWSAFAGAAGDVVSAATAIPVNRFQVRDRRAVPGPLPIDRNPELSDDQLVVVGSGSGGAALSWQLIRDPRVVRSEHPGPDGVLAGETLLRTDVQLLLAVPDLPQLTDVRLYQPRWDGARWRLELVGSFPIGPAR